MKNCKKNGEILLLSKKSRNFAADLEKINLIILRRYERNSEKLGRNHPSAGCGFLGGLQLRYAAKLAVGGRFSNRVGRYSDLRRSKQIR